MLESDIKEKEQTEIELPEKNYNDVVSFLKCIYPDRMENVTNDTVYRVVPLAHEYQINALITKCHELLLQLVKSKHLDNAIEICRHIQIAENYNLGDLNKRSVSIASEFSLEELDKAAKKYSITGDSLIEIHRQARMREELNKKDGAHLRNDINDKDDIKDYITDQLKQNCEMSTLKALRLCYRYFPENRRLFEKTFRSYKSLPKRNDSTIEKQLNLLPEILKQKLLLE